MSHLREIARRLMLSNVIDELEPGIAPIGSSIFGRAIFAQSKPSDGYRANESRAKLETKKEAL
jgi:hypothetical protein